MRGSELLDKMDLVDPAYVAEADRPVNKKNHWKRWTALAACLCLAVGGAIWGVDRHDVPAPNPVPPAPEIVWEDIFWNQTKENGLNADHAIPNAIRRYVPGYFERELTEEECAKLLPAGVEANGQASFSGEGELLGVTLTCDGPSGPVTVLLGENARTVCLLPDGTTVSRLGDAEFILWRTELEQGRLLTASLQGQEAVFHLELPAGSDWKRGEEDFLTALKPFAAWSRGCPKLELSSGPIPAWIDRELTLREALADPTFGSWVLPAAPKGFVLESARRSMSEYWGTDLLTQCWTRSLAQLDWRVEKFDRADEARLVHPEEREKYDMALYPIPLCDSVPQELWEVVYCPIFESEELTEEMVKARAYRVEDTGDEPGWRVHFSVCYGDRLVTVRAKGVEPGWLYDQLSRLPK